MPSPDSKTGTTEPCVTDNSVQRYLLIKHSKGWDCDRISQWMRNNKIVCDWCYPADGDSLPEPGLYKGVISFGGAVSANDCTTLPWVKEEIKFIEQCLKHELRFFGICLGAQMLARVLGAKVSPQEPELKEVGFHRVDPTCDSGDFLQQSMMMMQWHSEGFELPAGTRCSATGDDFPNQAFHMSKHIFGVQFHPEVNPEALAVWHERNKTRPKGVLSEDERQSMMRDAKDHNDSITTWVDGVLQRWVA